MLSGVALLPAFHAVLADAERRAQSIVSFDRGLAKAGMPYLDMDAETDEGRRSQAKFALSGAIAKYPPISLLNRLDRVFVLEKIWTGKAQMGGAGSADGRSVLLATGGYEAVDGPWIARAFHHELAHLIRNRHLWAFPTKAWRAACPPGWKYPLERGDLTVLTDPRYTEAYDAKLNAMGFLSAYGSANPEEDWATFGEAILTNDPEFRSIVARFPRVRTKAQLAVAFYRDAMPGIRLPALPLAE